MKRTFITSSTFNRLAGCLDEWGRVVGDCIFLSVHMGAPRQDQQQGVCHAIL